MSWNSVHGVCSRLKEIGTHQINKLETQHTGTHNNVICYGVGKGLVSIEITLE